MGFYRWVLSLLGVICCLIVHTVCQTDTAYNPPSPGEAFRNIILGDSYVLIGSSNSLYRLNPGSLSVEDSRQLGSVNRLLVTDPGGTYDGSVLACEEQVCALTPINNLTDIRWQVSSGLVSAGTENVIGIFAPGTNGTSSLSFGKPQTETLYSSIRKGNLINVNIPGSSFFNRFATQVENDRFRPREFLAAFTDQSFIYFIVWIEINQVDQMRVVRFCKDDPGDLSRPPQFVSHFELVGECTGSSSSTINTPTAATYVGANSTFGTATLLVTFMGDGETDQRMCAYNISTINDLMTQKFRSCLDGVGRRGFEREVQEDCPMGLSEGLKQSVVSDQYIFIELLLVEHMHIFSFIIE